MTSSAFAIRSAALDDMLIKATRGQFAEALNRVCREHYDFLDPDEDLVVPLVFARGITATLNIEKRNVRRVEYAPSRWNPWPRVTPPEGVWMHIRGKGALIYHDDAWWDSTGNKVTLDTDEEFRPLYLDKVESCYENQD